ncbi:unnamed protein product, partial [marine sediment metagenome]
RAVANIVGTAALISSAHGFAAAFVVDEEIPQSVYRMVIKPVF